MSNSQAAQFEGLGHAVCSDLANGNTVQQEVTEMYNSHLNTDFATGVLSGAVGAYCPQFQGEVSTWANSN